MHFCRVAINANRNTLMEAPRCKNRQPFVWPFVTSPEAKGGSLPTWAEAADDTFGPRNWLDPLLSISPTPELYPPEPRGAAVEEARGSSPIINYWLAPSHSPDYMPP